MGCRRNGVTGIYPWNETEPAEATRAGDRDFVAYLTDDMGRSERRRAMGLGGRGAVSLYRRFGTELDRDLPGCEAFVIDDTGFAKKGRYSVGVARGHRRGAGFGRAPWWDITAEDESSARAMSRFGPLGGT
jgi:hypothetical protein